MSYYERNLASMDGFIEMMAEQDAVFAWIQTLSTDDEQTLMRLLHERKTKWDLEHGATLARPVAQPGLSLDVMKTLLAIAKSVIYKEDMNTM